MTRTRSMPEFFINLLLLVCMLTMLVVMPLGLLAAWNAMLSGQFVGAGVCLLAVTSCACGVFYIFAGR